MSRILGGWNPNILEYSYSPEAGANLHMMLYGWNMSWRKFQEQHENVEECLPSARPSPAALTAAPSASHACREMCEVQMQLASAPPGAAVGVREPPSRLYTQRQE